VNGDSHGVAHSRGRPTSPSGRQQGPIAGEARVSVASVYRHAPAYLPYVPLIFPCPRRAGRQGGGAPIPGGARRRGALDGADRRVPSRRDTVSRGARLDARQRGAASSA